jgi:multidrug efflux system membrane fusion protein
MHANRWVLGTVGLVVIGGSGLWLHGKQRSGVERASAAASANADRPIAVTATTVTKADVPITLDGLGTVTPLQTVTVKSQVDGLLQSVAFKEGDAVKKGELLAQIDPRPFVIRLHQAQAALAKDDAQLKNVELTLHRNEALLKEGLITQQQVDDQRALLASTQATIKADQTVIESARLDVDYARVRSPIDGVTGVRLVDPGNVIRASDSGLVVVTQLDPIAVVFTLPQDDLPRVTTELAKGPLGVEAYSRDGTKKLATGQLLLVDNQINASTGTIRLKATLPNPDKLLWPNGFVKARLLLTTRKDAIVVPATVVQRGPKGTFAYVVDKNMTASVRPIEPDVFQGDMVIIAKGLVPGERVVVDGQNQLKPGGKVSIRLPEGTHTTSGSASARETPP